MPDRAGASAAASAVVLDTAEATARVLGDGGLYLRMVRRFHHDHPAAARPIREALACADLDLAHRLAHTLKGSAGMIGAHHLQHCAAVLEQRLRRDGAQADNRDLAMLEAALAQVLVAIECLLEGAVVGEVAPAVAAPLAPHGIAGPLMPLLLKQLVELLDTGDGAAIDLLEQAGPGFKATLGALAFSEVMLATHAFDFEAALASLRRALPQAMPLPLQDAGSAPT